MANIESVKLPDGTSYDIKDNISGYAHKVASPTADNLVVQTASGDIADSGISANDVAVKVSSATAGDIPILKSDGSTEDSGYKPSDLIQSNLNLLDNAFFTVNERGKSSYSTVGYTVDRWTAWTNNTIITPLSKGIQIEYDTSATTYKDLIQIVNNYADLLGKEVTLSADIACDIDLKLAVNYAGNYVVDKIVPSGTNGIVSFTTVIPSDISRVWIIISNPTGTTGTATVRSVKLELGEVSTLALDVPRPYAEELARCQTSTADANDTYANKGNIVTSNSIAPTEDGATASKAYSVGSHFFRGGDYCTCIQAIASGGSFTLNTNYKVTNLDGKLLQEVKTFTAVKDGVKTVKQLLEELASTLSSYLNTNKCIYKYSNLILNGIPLFPKTASLNSTFATSMFAGAYTDSVNYQMNMVVLTTSGATWSRMLNGTCSDQSSTVASSNIELNVEIYK